ncbi:MAG: hypothetical protein KC493_05785 [Bacteriovoracaceae bacterium]|nr:hypothetical protein [Bacteriovoracaceae bacterium]
MKKNSIKATIRKKRAVITDQVSDKSSINVVFKTPEELQEKICSLQEEALMNEKDISLISEDCLLKSDQIENLEKIVNDQTIEKKKLAVENVTLRDIVDKSIVANKSLRRELESERKLKNKSSGFFNQKLKTRNIELKENLYKAQKHIEELEEDYDKIIEEKENIFNDFLTSNRALSDEILKVENLNLTIDQLQETCLILSSQLEEKKLSLAKSKKVKRRNIHFTRRSQLTN